MRIDRPWKRFPEQKGFVLEIDDADPRNAAYFRLKANPGNNAMKETQLATSSKMHLAT